MNRKYDIVVFGASGYTGQFVVKELAVYHSEINWCVAGRSRQKLTSVLKEIEVDINKSLDKIDIITADTSDETSLEEMCKSTSVVINCVGPFRFFGEQVVKQCVKAGTHHVDVSGEPQFLETMQLKYFDEAKEKNVYIVGSCGFDSIPCDFGIEVVKRKFDGDVHSVETFLEAESSPGSTVNFGTWQSAVYGLAHAAELAPLRKSLKEKLFSKPLPKPKHKMTKRPTLFKSDEVKGWCIPFIGSDRSVVQRTQMFNYQFKNERPVQVQCYMKMNSFFTSVVTLMMGAIFMLMTKFSIGCYMLERFPELFSLGMFSKDPPSKDMNLSGKFQMTYKVKGWTEKLAEPADIHTSPPNQTATAVLKGPDPGYVATAIFIVSSALVVLQETDKLPLSGGVFTPGSAFIDTSLAKRLESRGITISGLKST